MPRTRFSDPVNLRIARDLLNAEFRRAEHLTKGATVYAALHGIFPSMRRGDHLVPIDEGNLRASSYMAWGDAAHSPGANFSSRRSGKAERLSAEHPSRLQAAQARSGDDEGGFVVELGYTAYYAMIVHEDLYQGTFHKTHKPFFLTGALNEGRGKIASLFKSYYARHRKRK